MLSVARRKDKRLGPRSNWLTWVNSARAFEMATHAPRIAIVDDDRSVRKALFRLLGGAAFEVRTFASAPEFLEEFRLFKPDCIVLDLQMPQMTGLDVQRHMARIGTAIPVIIITGH